MKTAAQLREILAKHPLRQINSHIHTHVCDGKPDMTVENIAAAAEAVGLSLIILVPHFHRQVSDGVTTLYENSDPQIFTQLRDEIRFYESRSGRVQFLLSTEADILDVDGTLSLEPSALAEKALDFVTPTLNYHPLLPLSAVAVTHTKEVDDFHEDGTFGAMAEAAGGRAHILETSYQAMTNAIARCPYPAMVGHFFCAHTIPRRAYTWFGLQPEDKALVYRNTEALLRQCKASDAIVDLTGIHMFGCDAQGQREKDGWLHTFQKDVLTQCQNSSIPFCPGSDAHNLKAVGDVHIYTDIFQW